LLGVAACCERQTEPVPLVDKSHSSRFPMWQNLFLFCCAMAWPTDRGNDNGMSSHGLHFDWGGDEGSLASFIVGSTLQLQPSGHCASKHQAWAGSSWPDN